jgi:hypothetical protein
MIASLKEDKSLNKSSKRLVYYQSHDLERLAPSRQAFRMMQMTGAAFQAEAIPVSKSADPASHTPVRKIYYASN